ncbi:MAG TPA: branched-chain-amino-acid transaminase [Chthoniobacterales bacterium]|nr:branched-chain-amino-acid transaminase [Chthoniobacterales bacterium]
MPDPTSTADGDTMVIDEPQTRGVATTPAVKPANESKTSEPAKQSTIYIDGEFLPESEAKVSVFDHGLLYGDGVFEGIRFYNGRVFRLEEHHDRLWDSARSICLDIPMTKEEMTAALLETVRQNGLRDGYIRQIVTRGVGNLGLNPVQCKRPSVIIIAATIALYPENVYHNGLTIVTCATRRAGAAVLNPAVKSLNYLNNVMARIEANLAGADEALMLNDVGNVAECTADNVFIIKKGQIFTPPISAGALRGITRSVVFEIAAELGIKITETDITRHDVFVADECFLTGTAAEVIPVIKADGRVIGTGKPGAISTRMIARFRELVRASGTPIYT